MALLGARGRFGALGYNVPDQTFRVKQGSVVTVDLLSKVTGGQKPYSLTSHSGLTNAATIVWTPTGFTYTAKSSAGTDTGIYTVTDALGAVGSGSISGTITSFTSLINGVLSRVPNGGADLKMYASPKLNLIPVGGTIYGTDAWDDYATPTGNHSQSVKPTSAWWSNTDATTEGCLFRLTEKYNKPLTNTSWWNSLGKTNIAMIEMENYTKDADFGTKPASWTARAKAIRNIVEWVHTSCPSFVCGYYGMMPITPVAECRAASGAGHDDWVTGMANADFVAAGASMGYYHPSVYYQVNVITTFAQWQTSADNCKTVISAMSGNAPVYIGVSPNGGDATANPPPVNIDGPTWTKTLDYIAKNFDGFSMWNGLTVTATEPWYKAHLDWVAANL
jgi:hypothetical protein